MSARDLVPPVAEAAPRGARWWAPLSIFALHMLVKLAGAGRASLWLDEAVAAHIAQRGPLGILEASRGDTTPPLYYLVLGAWERVFGIGEAALRAPSALASAGTAAVLFAFARRWLGAPAAWFASALFLVSESGFRFAHQARPYALAQLLAVVSFSLLTEALARGGRRRWGALALVNGLLLFTHYVAAFFVAAEGLCLLLPWRGRRRVLAFAVPHLALLVLLAAWVRPLFLAGQQHKMDWLEVAGAGHFAEVFGLYGAGHKGFARAAVLTACAAWALWRARRAGAPLAPILPGVALWAAVPLAGAFAVSQLVPMFHARYLLYASTAFVLLWAMAWAALPPGRSRLVGGALALALVAVGFRPRRPHGNPDWRSAAAWAQARPAGPCALLLPEPWEVPTLAYYLDPAAFRDPLHTAARLAAGGVHVGRGAAPPSEVREALVVSADPGLAEDARARLEAAGFRVVERPEIHALRALRLKRE